MLTPLPLRKKRKRRRRRKPSRRVLKRRTRSPEMNRPERFRNRSRNPTLISQKLKTTRFSVALMAGRSQLPSNSQMIRSMGSQSERYFSIMSKDHH
jgi:hypothetical protein